ncbi:MAG TPA: nuclear transport factor 2 family protein [Solirubrobacteraceae bacterium]|nr:nuclear transport factor 2 family protein [Solirubrobacteraceae bacterium]
MRRSFEAYASGGIEATLPFYAPDFVWDPGPEWVEEAVYRGHDGVRRLDAIFSDNFDDYSVELREVRPVGDRVLALYEAIGRIKGSNRTIRQPVGIVVDEIRDGKIAAIRSYFTWPRALNAVGLAE